MPRRRRPTDPIDETPHGGRAQPQRRRTLAWQMVPLRGRFLSPSTRYVYERLPDAPQVFTAADVAVLCVEADNALPDDAPCNPAEVIDLLAARSLVRWAEGGFVKSQRTPRPRPKA